MHERSAISSFRPTDAWHTDWPYGVRTEVGVQASSSGLSAATAVQEFVEPLMRDPDAGVPSGVRVDVRGGDTAEARFARGALPATRAGTAP